MAGPTPGGPRHSHQMTRDLSIMGSMPYLDVVEPCSMLMFESLYNYVNSSDEKFLYKNYKFIIELRTSKEFRFTQKGYLAELFKGKGSNNESHNYTRSKS